MGSKRKTNKEFIEEMAILHPTIEVISKYTKFTEPIKLRCKECGKEWETTPAYILRKKYSCECSKRIDPRCLSQDEYEDRFYKISNHIKLITPYETCRKKVHVKCNVCNYEWDVRPLDFLDSGECPKCIGKLKKTTNIFKEELSKINSDIEVIGEYIGANVDIRCRCKICGREWNSRPSNLLHGAGCINCYKNNEFEKTKNKFYNEIKIKNPYIDIVGEYKGDKKHITCRCKKCNNIWDTAIPHNLLRGSGCPECAKKAISSVIRKSPDCFKSELEKVNPDIELLEDYKLSTIKIKCKCKKCNNIWDANPSDILHNGSGCPYCKMSKGEEAIKDILDRLNFNYKREYKLFGCESKISLRFDYAIFIDEKLICVIEYQGIQHYKPIDFAGKGKKWADESFISNQRRDEIKRSYCKENNIPLIEIPYYEYKNMENILVERLGLIKEECVA